MTMKKLFLLTLLLVGLGVVGGLVVAGRLSMTTPSTASMEATAPQSRPSATMPATAGLPDLSGVAERALKVAANISSTSIVQTDSMFGFRGRAQRAQSTGSGVVVSADGYVLTNSHVLFNSRDTTTKPEVLVTLQDGRERQAQVVGVDDVSDLAVVKVEAQGLDTLPWGDSSQLRVAEWVLAVGNPFQLAGTVTLGIVSTVNRAGAQVGTPTGFIQTDAAVNPGNSGGALVNSRGELVGINARIASETGGYQGISFAIPSNLARNIMDELIKHGELPWGAIGGGIQWYELSRGEAQRYRYGDTAGLLVYNLSPASPAARAGLQIEDVVIGVNGQPTPSFEQFDNLIVNLKIGSTAKLDVIRKGQRQTISIPIISRQQTQGRGR
jgi:S1-C subfamily serine protease